MKVKTYLLLLLLSLALSSSNELNFEDQTEERILIPIKVRTKRGVFWDFFQKIVTTKNLVVDQFTDTKNTFNEVYNIVNDGFSDPAPSKPTNQPRIVESTTSSSSSDDETTTEVYRISRYELGRILGRNFRGLQRLMKIELQDAFNQSQYNIMEYKAEANKQFANSLAVEKKNHLKLLKG